MNKDELKTLKTGDVVKVTPKNLCLIKEPFFAKVFIEYDEKLGRMEVETDGALFAITPDDIIFDVSVSLPAIFWVKYRTGWSSGFSEWNYRWFRIETTDADIEELLVIPENAENNWSEHYRGVEWERTEVPMNVLENFIKGAHSEVKSAMTCLMMLEAFKKARK